MMILHFELSDSQDLLIFSLLHMRGNLYDSHRLPLIKGGNMSAGSELAIYNSPDQGMALATRV